MLGLAACAGPTAEEQLHEYEMQVTTICGSYHLDALNATCGVTPATGALEQCMTGDGAMFSTSWMDPSPDDRDVQKKVFNVDGQLRIFGKVASDPWEDLGACAGVTTTVVDDPFGMAGTCFRITLTGCI